MQAGAKRTIASFICTSKTVAASWANNTCALGLLCIIHSSLAGLIVSGLGRASTIVTGCALVIFNQIPVGARLVSVIAWVLVCNVNAIA